MNYLFNEHEQQLQRSPVAHTHTHTVSPTQTKQAPCRRSPTDTLKQITSINNREFEFKIVQIEFRQAHDFPPHFHSACVRVCICSRASLNTKCIIYT